MAFPTKLLNRNEEIVLDLRPHWWYIAPHSAALAGAVILGIVVLAADAADALKWIVGLLVLAAVGAFVARYMRWAGMNFVVTTERVIFRSGIVSKRGIEIPLERINTVFFNQSIFERILGSGDLGIESAGEGGRQNFDNVRRPNHVQQEIYRAMEEVEQRRLAAYGRTMAAGAAESVAAENVGGTAPRESIPEQIERLDSLRARGIITEEEFAAKKRDLLDRM
jgi:uncharacterized membrane protein YdbT with pleckstrin-like domain